MARLIILTTPKIIFYSPLQLFFICHTPVCPPPPPLTGLVNIGLTSSTLWTEWHQFRTQIWIQASSIKNFQPCFQNPPKNNTLQLFFNNIKTLNCFLLKNKFRFRRMISRAAHYRVSWGWRLLSFHLKRLGPPPPPAMSLSNLSGPHQKHFLRFLKLHILLMV